MNELIAVRKESIGNAVSARELYLGLGLAKANWSVWLKGNIENNDFFIERRDWQGFMFDMNGNETKDFAITIEFAKHLAMMAKTEKAHEYRNYFLECEKKASRTTLNFVADELDGALRIAKLFGLFGNQALLSANRAVKAQTNIDSIALLGVTLTAPVQERTMTPSDIGVQLGLSGIKVNQLLKDIGYQIDSRDAKERLVWTATAEGAKHSELSDTGKRQSDGTPVKQLKWFAHVVEDLAADI